MNEQTNFSVVLKEYINSFTSPNSRLAYIRDLKQYQNWCMQVGVHDLFSVDEKLATEYRDFLTEQFATKTVERKLSAVKGLYRITLEKKLIKEDPFACIRPIEKEMSTKKSKPLDHSEVQRILLFPNLKTEEGQRDYTLLFLLFSLGLKIGELVNLHRQDFKKYENGFLVQIRKLNGTHYYTKLPLNCLEVINRYVKECNIQGFLFTSIAKNSPTLQKDRTPLAVRSGWVILKKYLRKAKLERKGRTTNCAREFFIKALTEEGYGPEILQKVLGLQSLNAMRRYSVDNINIAKEQLLFKDHPVDKIQLNIRDY